MSKHYRLSKQQLIDLERYEIRLADDKIFFNDSTETFFHPYNSEDEAKAEFEKICALLTKKKNEPLFYEADGGAIINLSKVKAITLRRNPVNLSGLMAGKLYLCFEFSNEIIYRKTFDIDEQAEIELDRLNKLLVK